MIFKNLFREVCIAEYPYELTLIELRSKDGKILVPSLNINNIHGNHHSLYYPVEINIHYISRTIRHCITNKRYKRQFELGL